jgi:hypothetical protein
VESEPVIVPSARLERIARYHARVLSRSCAIVLAVALGAIAGRTGAAESSRHPLSYDAAAAETASVKRYEVEVGDVPRHVLRLFDTRRIFARRPPVFDGARATEMHERGTADLIDQSGSESAYVTYLLEDGNRVFGRYAGTIRSARWPDGSWHHEIQGRIELTGGTSRFAALRGHVQVRFTLDPGAESSQGESAGEYWFER